jgi:opacity protein-like surface antigen
MKQDWTDELRKRMENHRAEAPAELRTRLDAALDEHLRRRARTVLLRRLVAAAAVVGIISLGAVWLLPSRQEAVVAHKSVHRQPEQPVQAPSSLPKSDTASPVQGGSSLLARLHEALTRSAAAVQPEASQHAAAGRQEPLLAQQDSGQDSRNMPDGEPEATPTQPGGHEQNQQKPQPYRPQASTTPTAYGYNHTRRPADGTRWNVDLYAQNGYNSSMGAPNQAGVRMSNELLASYQLAKPALRAAQHETVYLAGYSEQTKHRLPLTVGLTVSYRLNGRWAVESGVVYSYLSSDFTQVMRDARVTRQQRLQYVGVPLGLRYTLWDGRHLSVYATGGGQVDFNVKAQSKTEGVKTGMKKDRPQWSAQMGVGAQYNLNSQIGVYVEPGGKYEFNNHSGIRSAWTDKPWNLNLKVGLRWNIK